MRSYNDWLIEQLKNIKQSKEYVLASIEDGDDDVFYLAIKQVWRALKKPADINRDQPYCEWNLFSREEPGRGELIVAVRTVYPQDYWMGNYAGQPPEHPWDAWIALPDIFKNKEF